AMTDELHRMGIKLMVSIWPQIDLESENYNEMRRRNFLAKTRTGKDVGMWWPRDSQFFDATNPEARQWLWEKIRKNYTDLGVDAFWLDEAEPEWGGDYDYAHYVPRRSRRRVGGLPREVHQTSYRAAVHRPREQRGQPLARRGPGPSGTARWSIRRRALPSTA
ncbi:MAG: TIM-barrel domain-containing protein, partial [Bifidobacterium breve]